MRMQLLARTVLLGVVALVSAGTVVGAQERTTNVGARAGYTFDTEEILLSANLVVPMTSRAEFYPSVDIYAPERGSKIGFNGDFKIYFPKLGRFVYGGFGAGVISSTVGDSSKTEFGANLLLGLEARLGWLHPFAEGRAIRRDQTHFQLIGGFNISRGP
jgi:hypothetical protein